MLKCYFTHFFKGLLEQISILWIFKEDSHTNLFKINIIIFFLKPAAYIKDDIDNF